MPNVRDLSRKFEFVFVITLAFGYSILASVLSLFTPPAEAAISEAGLRSLIVHELVVFAALALFLSARGWDRQQLGLMASRTDPLAAVALGVVAYVAYLATWFAIGRLVPGSAELPDGMIESDLGLGTVLVASVINGTFEEVFVCSYVISTLKQSRSASLVRVDSGRSPSLIACSTPSACGHTSKARCARLQLRSLL